MSRGATAKVTGSKRLDAYERVLSAIIFGDLPAGASVDEKQICKMFGLGLAVVRDALARLALERLVERHARIGTRIPELSLRELHEIFETRVVMEGAAAALAAERASSEEIAALRAAFDGVDEAITARDYRRVVEMDQDFHRRLAAATKNDHIERSIVLLHKNALRFWYFGLERMAQDIIRADIRTHFQVVDAIAARDAEAAAAAMRRVIGAFPDNMRFLIGGASALGEARPLMMPTRQPKVHA